MTGFERNADVVHMTTPAPLFAHVDGWQWRPDQIWYDQTEMFKTVSYYVQQMYATNKGTNVLSLTMGKKPVANLDEQDGLFASAAFDKDANEVIIKIANTSYEPREVSFNLNGMKGKRAAQTLTLSHNGMDDENTISKPRLITPQKSIIQVEEGKGASLLNDKLPPMSFRIYRIKK
jgi:alpha-L-arabinofuranosidase